MPGAMAVMDQTDLNKLAAEVAELRAQTRLIEQSQTQTADAIRLSRVLNTGFQKIIALLGEPGELSKTVVRQIVFDTMEAVNSQS